MTENTPEHDWDNEDAPEPVVPPTPPTEVDPEPADDTPAEAGDDTGVDDQGDEFDQADELAGED